MRISSYFSTHFAFCYNTFLEFDSRISQFCSVTFCSVPFCYTSFFFVSIFSCMLFVVSVEILWRPFLPKKKIDQKRNINLTTKYWLNETKICWLNYFKLEKKIFPFLFMGCPIDKNDLFSLRFHFLLNFMLEGTMKMVENWRKQIHIGFKFKKTWHVRYTNTHTQNRIFFY